MKRFILSIAAMALTLSPFVAQADDVIDISQSLYVGIDKNISENTNVSNNKNLNVNIDANIRIRGSEWLYDYYGCRDYGYGCRGLTVDGLASAEINNNQILKFNRVINKENPNTATIDGSALEGAEGNIGVNVVAGDNNAQDNLTAMAASEQEKSMADAEIFKTQLSFENFTGNEGRTNSASLGGDALMGAIGNIGVNVAAGNNNAQSNMLAIAVAPAKVGIAKVSVHQESAGNTTNNNPVKVDKVEYLPVKLDLSATLDGKYSGGASGTTSGMSYQANNFYPDVWVLKEGKPAHGQHPNSPSEIGHADMDNETQGAIANPNRGGVGGLAFDNKGEYSGTETGSLGGSILGTVTGSIPVVIKRNVNMINTASLGGNALRGATGNIGVNIAAGTGNLQANALAVTYIAPVNGGGGESIIK